MEEVLLYFEKYRDESFKKNMDLAKTVALEMNVEHIIPTKCRVITKKYFGENNETVNITHQRNHLKSSIFLPLI
jgi:hypothetical protein